MSVLSCPVCKGAMREVNREGILIDVCTQCRGVWLDRGELEKLASFMPAPMAEPRPMRPAPDDYAYRERRRDWDDDDDDNRRYRGGGDRDPRQRSKMARFLDFFD
jgi:Zn-finger nucleic acid-binding protein